MKKKVVVGAGPAGLYFAIKAVKAGLKNVVIYDPRAGNYTRPGHLNLSALQKAEDGIGINFLPPKPNSKEWHIKDLERFLYVEAVRLRIPIKKERFIRLHDDPKAPGVVVADAEGVEEIVEADYVFDCTGSRREVIAAVNRVVPESPLKMEAFATLPVRHHVLAYVKMSDSDWKQLQMASLLVEVDSELFDNLVEPIAYAQSLAQLMGLGWRELKRPRFYGVSFGKNKVCLYFQAPEGLTRDNYDPWVQTVLESYVKPISYQHLPPSLKPRFVYFPMSAEALTDVSYNKRKDLPTVIGLGDVQIDFDYYLAHGIKDGFSRIDALFIHMEIFKGEIYYFHPDEYLATIHKQLEAHKNKVMQEADKTRLSFAKALELAELKFSAAIALTPDEQEKIKFTRILNEIEARLAYARAKKSFAECRDLTHPRKKDLITDKDFAKFNGIHSDLIKALYGLPPEFATERKDAQESLRLLALSWKETGNTLFKNKNIPKAVDAYARALEIYNLPGFVGQYELQGLPIYSNLVICYLGEKRYPEAIAVANMGLGILTSRSRELVPQILTEKIVFNLLRAICQQVQAYLEMPDYRESASLLCRHIRDFAVMYKEVLSIESQILISTNIADMEQKLASHLSDSGLENRGNSDADIRAISKLVSEDEVPGATGLCTQELEGSSTDSTEQTVSAPSLKKADALTTFGQFAPPKKPTLNPSKTPYCNLF